MYEELIGYELRKNIRIGNIIGENEGAFKKNSYIVKSFGTEVVFARVIGPKYYDIDSRLAIKNLISIPITIHRLIMFGFTHNTASDIWSFNELIIEQKGLVWLAKAKEESCLIVAIHELQNFYFKVYCIEFPLSEAITSLIETIIVRKKINP